MDDRSYRKIHSECFAGDVCYVNSTLRNMELATARQAYIIEALNFVDTLIKGEYDAAARKTSEQMKAAPKGAVYVWVNSNLIYPKALACVVGREDLRIVGPHMVEVLAHREMVVDHAAMLTNRQLECIREGGANGRV